MHLVPNDLKPLSGQWILEKSLREFGKESGGLKASSGSVMTLLIRRVQLARRAVDWARASGGIGSNTERILVKHLHQQGCPAHCKHLCPSN